MHDDEILCRCREVTFGEVREVIRRGYRTIREIRRLTRAGTGLCQGRTCETLMQRLIAEETGGSVAGIEPSVYRVPVVPVAVGALARDATYRKEKDPRTDQRLPTS